MLEQMQGLMHLELSGCNDFTEAGLWSSLNARLTSLSVSDCINVADDAIAAISQLLPNLSELSLQAYHVTDTAMAYFTAKQVSSQNITAHIHLPWFFSRIFCQIYGSVIEMKDKRYVKDDFSLIFSCCCFLVNQLYRKSKNINKYQRAFNNLFTHFFYL